MLNRLQQEVRTLLVDADGTNASASRWRQVVRFWVVVGLNFVRNRCPVRASALAYSSLLAFIPLLAVIIGISTGVLKNDEERIKDWIDDVLENVAPQLMKSAEFAATKDTVVGYVTKTIENVQSGAVGTTGIIALLVMILFMLARIEETLNDIWGVPQGRSWYARLVNYWAAISLGPIVIFAAIGFSTTLHLGQVKKSTLDLSDIVDLPSFATVLKNPANGPSEFFHRRLSPATRQLLGAWDSEKSPHPNRALEEALVRDLNVLINGPRLWQSNTNAGENPFAGVATRTATSSRPAAGQSEDKVARLNRMLLEDIYPQQLRRLPANWLASIPFIGSFLLRLIPLPILGGACALFYALMPNTKVQWRAALVGGLVAGVLWLFNNELSVRFVTQATRNRAIYGSLAAVPVFMISLYFFWLLLLFGAQVAYTFQNRRTYLRNQEVDRVHQAGREFVALRVMIEAARAFATGGPAPTVSSLAERLEVPAELISKTTNVLLHTRLLVMVNQGESGFLPARPLDAIRVADVLGSMRRGVGSRFPTTSDSSRAEVEVELAQVAAAEQQAGVRTLAEFVEPARPAGVSTPSSREDSQIVA